MLRYLRRNDIWISEKLNFDYLKNKKSFLSDYNGTRTHNHLVRKRTLNHLAKLTFLIEIKNIFLVRKVLSFKRTKQTT